MIPVSQKLSDLRPFWWVKLRQYLKAIKLSIFKISLTFRDLYLIIFYVRWNKFIFLSVYTKFQVVSGHLVPHTMNLSGPKMPWQIGLSQADFVTTQPKIIHVLLWLWQHEVLIKCRPIHGVWQQQGWSRQHYINALGHSNTLTANKYLRTQNKGWRK